MHSNEPRPSRLAGQVNPRREKYKKKENIINSQVKNTIKSTMMMVIGHGYAETRLRCLTQQSEVKKKTKQQNNNI